MAVGSDGAVSCVVSSTSSVLYLVGSDDMSIMMVLLLSDMSIDMPSVETLELLVSLFDDEWS